MAVAAALLLKSTHLGGEVSSAVLRSIPLKEVAAVDAVVLVLVQIRTEHVEAILSFADQIQTPLGAAE